ncbi:MAG: pyruvate formate lyase family protein [Candidatus Sumerlaeia bacterium]
MQDRIQKLKQYVIELDNAGVRRTTYFPLIGESLAATQGEPRMLRRAKAFVHIIKNTPPVVHPYETLAGSILGIWPVEKDLPDYEERRTQAIAVVEAYKKRKRENPESVDRGVKKQTRWALMARDHYNANIEYPMLQKLIGELCDYFAGDSEVEAYEVGRELERYFNFDYGPEVRRLMNELPWDVANHLDLNYGKAVRTGLGPMRAIIMSKLESTRDNDKREFYEATLLCLEAAVRHIHRYADHLREMSHDPDLSADRTRELVEMAVVCDRVAESKPENFREALQLVWLLHIIANLGGGSALSFARFDQYLIPFYRADIESGAITREQAKELISCLWLKVNEPKMRTVQSMCVAGTTPDGQDAANELSDICLEICTELCMPYPNLSARVHKDSPEWLMDRIVDTMKAGIGHPMVLNDDMWVPNLHRHGYKLEEAREYYNMGCVEIMIQGKMPNWGGGCAVDFPSLVELVFRNGETNMIGETGIATGTLDSFKTFDDFLNAYLEQLRHKIVSQRPNVLQQIEDWKMKCDPFSSIFVEDCIEKGLDIFRGGSRIDPVRASGGFGLGTAVDSLSAIKAFVYDEKSITLEEMWEALQANYVGYEDLQKKLENRTPSFGNDNDEVDAIACRIFDCFCDTVHAQNGPDIPGRFSTVFFSYNHHVYAAETIDATPNGRRRSEPMSDAIGPTQGRDLKGPTSLINSVTKLDHSKVTGAYALNMRFTKSLVSGATGTDALKNLIRTLFAKGGMQIQVNVVDAEVLKEAREKPDQHRDLVVRVAGYSEFFTNLDRHLQDEIISRTAHAV